MLLLPKTAASQVSVLLTPGLHTVPALLGMPFYCALEKLMKELSDLLKIFYTAMTTDCFYAKFESGITRS